MKSSKKSRMQRFASGFVGGAAIVLFTATSALAGGDQGKAYVPGLGDLMNESMQLHHTKLWIAGHADNWALAAYEVKEMGETVDDIATFQGNWHGKPIGAMAKSLTPDLELLNQAIQARNPVKFDTAFHKLTATCNGCHAGTGHPEIVVMEPSPQGGGNFSDQNFLSGSGPQ